MLKFDQIYQYMAHYSIASARRRVRLDDSLAAIVLVLISLSSDRGSLLSG